MAGHRTRHPAGTVLRANADTLSQASGQHLRAAGGYLVLFRAGTSLGEAGLVTQARDYYQRMHAPAHTRLGPDHPDTLYARNNFAYWRGEAVDPSGAAVALEELLADRLRVLGPDHPDTLATQHHLARWRGEAGDAAGAVAEFEEMLADRLRVLDPITPTL